MNPLTVLAGGGGGRVGANFDSSIMSLFSFNLPSTASTVYLFADFVVRADPPGGPLLRGGGATWG